jgi:hypothetical protein
MLQRNAALQTQLSVTRQDATVLKDQRDELQVRDRESQKALGNMEKDLGDLKAQNEGLSIELEELRRLEPKARLSDELAEKVGACLNARERTILLQD